MKTILTGALAAITLAGALSATAMPAAAATYHGGHAYVGARGGWRGGGWGPGGAALLGLGVGAAIAGAAYGYPAYYGPPCRIEPRWNPYLGVYEQVRVCY